jgi:hypothetical protein
MSLLLEADVTRHIISLCRSLSDDSTRAVMLDMSLTHSLAFDSMKLMQFFAGVEALYPGVALEDWFIEHCTDGRDTLRSAVSHLMRFLGPQAAKG